MTMRFQVQGHYSERTMVLGTRHYVVWKNSVPVRCYPQLLDSHTLKDLPELQDFNPDLLIDPIDPKRKQRVATRLRFWRSHQK